MNAGSQFQSLFRSTFAGLLGSLLLAGSAFAATNGPDVTVFDLSGTQNYGLSSGIRGYAVGTVSCNIGNQPLNWCDQTSGCAAGAQTNDHPVIAQNMYRLKNGRMDQIGASWLKHGFLSTNSPSSTCSADAGVASCQSPPAGGNQLGIGCTDPYGASLNGGRPLGPKSEVNPTTGDYPFPFTNSGSQAEVWNQRLAVAQTDLESASNPSARYFVEGHYIAPDDAASGNGLNNASWREVTVNQSTFNLTFANSTQRRQSVIEAWQVIDNTVELYNADVQGSNPVQRFRVARKVTDLGGGTFHYEYAIHNMNAERGADRFGIRFPSGTTITNAGFHDVNPHSGSPYDTADWPAVINGSEISWTVPAFPSSPNDANTIRWGTMYNFWFDATQPPTLVIDHNLRFFGGGGADSNTFWTNVETPEFVDSFE